MNGLQAGLEFANRAYIVALILGAVAAVMVLVSSWLVIRWQAQIQAQKDEAFVAYQAQAAARIAEAESTAAVARQQTVELELALERLRTPRTLQPDQVQALRAALLPLVNDLDHRLTVSSTSEDESRMYAGQFMALFRSLGIDLVNIAEGLVPHEDIRETERGPTDLAVIVDSDDQNQVGADLVDALAIGGLTARLERFPRLQYGRVYLAVFVKR